MKFKNYFYFALVSMIMGLCSSCSGDDVTDGGEEPTPPPIPESTLYADVDYMLTCSEDLLLYVTPQVTYTDNDGTKKTITINDSEWSETKEAEFHVTFKDGSTDAKLMMWTKRVRYTNFPIDKEMTVKYVLKENIPPYDRMKINKFYHYPSVAMDFVKNEGNSKYSQSSVRKIYNVGYTNSNETLQQFITGYIDYLGMPFVWNQANYASIVLGADNDYISGMVGKFTDKQGLKVNNDGTYSVKYEDEDYVAPKPYADIVYTLNISEEMLQYSVPQVTYTGNDGKPVTYTIDEKEFEVNEKLNKWWEHPHGEEGKTYTEGEEDAKILRWRKHIHYADISTVDDEMTVTYIPKDNAGDMRLVHAYHNLSAGLVLSDKNGKIITQPTNNYKDLSSNIVHGIGPFKVVYNYYEDGVPVRIPISIPAGRIIGHGTHYLYEDGVGIYVPTYKFVFDTFKDYQGVHLERNGDFKWKEPNKE